MKKYIRSAEDITHLRDILSRIRYFVIVDDVANCNFGLIHSSEDIDNTDDEYYLTIPDNRLAQVSDRDLSNITNFDVLDRFVKINQKDRLSEAHLSILRDEYKKKYDVDEQDCKLLLEMFKQCNRIHMTSSIKNLNFMNRYDLDDDDVLAILHNLTFGDVYKRTRSIQYQYLGNNLIIFYPTILIPDADIFVSVSMYIKLDIDESDGSCAAFVSFHPQHEYTA